MQQHDVFGVYAGKGLVKVECILAQFRQNATRLAEDIRGIASARLNPARNW
jgi:hypothetical protein